MKKRTKLSIAGISILASALLLSGCTASFCSDDDKAHILYALDYGVSDYYDAADENKPAEAIQVFDENPNLFYVVNVPTDSGSGIGKTNADAAKAGLQIPQPSYFVTIDNLVLKLAFEKQNVDYKTATYNDLLVALDNFGYLKYAGDKLFDGWDDLNNQAEAIAVNTPTSDFNVDHLPTNDYVVLYKKNMNSLISNYRSCIAVSDGDYGYYQSLFKGAFNPLHQGK